MNANDLFAANLGKRVSSDNGIFTISLDASRTGTLKNGEKGVPYIKLMSEGNSIDLHPEKAKQLFTKGEFGALRIMADIAGEPVAAPAAVEDYSAVAETSAATEAPFTNPVETSASTESTATATATIEDTIAATEPKKESKKEATLRIYNELNVDGKQRKEIIARIRTELNMGAAGSNTYYQNPYRDWETDRKSVV